MPVACCRCRYSRARFRTLTPSPAPALPPSELRPPPRHFRPQPLAPHRTGGRSAAYWGCAPSCSWKTPRTAVMPRRRRLPVLQCTALASWGWASRLLATPRTRDTPPSRAGPKWWLRCELVRPGPCLRFCALRQPAQGAAADHHPNTCPRLLASPRISPHLPGPRRCGRPSRPSTPTVPARSSSRSWRGSCTRWGSTLCGKHLPRGLDEFGLQHANR